MPGSPIGQSSPSQKEDHIETFKLNRDLNNLWRGIGQKKCVRTLGARHIKSILMNFFLICLDGSLIIILLYRFSQGFQLECMI